MGTEIGMLRGYGFLGQVMAGDGSDKKDKMRAGYNNFRRKRKGSSAKWDETPGRRAPAQISLY